MFVPSKPAASACPRFYLEITARPWVFSFRRLCDACAFPSHRPPVPSGISSPGCARLLEEELRHLFTLNQKWRRATQNLVLLLEFQNKRICFVPMSMPLSHPGTKSSHSKPA
jgi:hypothetical protein